MFSTGCTPEKRINHCGMNSASQAEYLGMRPLGRQRDKAYIDQNLFSL